MITFENQCVGCEHCGNCGANRVEVVKCDGCGDDSAAIWTDGYNQFCETCLWEVISEMIFGDRSITKMLKAAEMFEIPTGKGNLGSGEEIYWVDNNEEWFFKEEAINRIYQILEDWYYYDTDEFLKIAKIDDWKRFS